jgi:hypothetical protein
VTEGRFKTLAMALLSLTIHVISIEPDGHPASTVRGN